jgi:hypothetical protein
MKETYYILENNNLRKVGNVIRTAKGYVTNPAAEDCASIGAYPRDEASFAPPTTDEGYHAVPDGYELKDGKWVKLWRVEPIERSTKDYDRAMEDYLKQVRSDRGYTLREPSPTYDDSPNPRWRSDAADWKVFFNEVMHYGLQVQNDFLATGNAPSLEEFKANLPRIEWSYTDGE